MRRIKQLSLRLLGPIWRSRTLGLASEAFFWWRWAGTKGLRWPQEYEKRLDPERPLLPAIASYASRVTTDPIRILDVGAGIATSIGYQLAGRSISITAVDVLAKTYAKIWARRGLSPPVPTAYADAEQLDQVFEPSSFDLVHACNSIDHAASPRTAIEQMLLVAKPGGYVLLDHALDEAVKEEYAGLHQWNFTEKDGELIVWNTRETLNMTALLAGLAQVKTEMRSGRVFVEIHKYG